MYPATLEQMKNFCRVSHDYDDMDFLEIYAPAAMEYMSDATGLTEEQLLAKREAAHPFLMVVHAKYEPENNADTYMKGADASLLIMSLKNQGT